MIKAESFLMDLNETDNNCIGLIGFGGDQKYRPEWLELSKRGELSQQCKNLAKLTANFRPEILSSTEVFRPHARACFFGCQARDCEEGEVFDYFSASFLFEKTSRVLIMIRESAPKLEHQTNMKHRAFLSDVITEVKLEVKIKSNYSIEQVMP